MSLTKGELTFVRFTIERCDQNCCIKSRYSTQNDPAALMSVVNALGARNRPPKRTAVHGDRVWVEAELKDVGDQALMRGLDTAFPIMRPGLFLSYYGRRSVPATKRLTDIPLPLFRLRPCARCKFAAVIYVLIA